MPNHWSTAGAGLQHHRAAAFGSVARFSGFIGCFPDERAARHLYEKIFAGVTVHSLAEPELAILRNESRLIVLRDQIVQVMVRFENDFASATAVTAIWSAFGTILLAAECDTTFSAVPTARVNFYFVNEH